MIARTANNHPNRAALVFINSDLDVVQEISYSALIRRIAGFATILREKLQPQQVVMINLDFGPDYIVALLGVLAASMIAIPGMPATRRSLSRQKSMAVAGKPSLIVQGELGDFSKNAYKTEIPTIEYAPTEAEFSDNFLPSLDDMAIIQFTSGSTSTPKGVMLTHRNITSNEKYIAQKFQHTDSIRLLGWLPLFHDMGLIGNTLQPLYMSGTAIMMLPIDVVSRPSNWLKAIDKFSVDTSGGPNFIYDLCTKIIHDKDVEGLDLSRWRTAFNGSEPIRAHTLRTFSDRFSKYGLKKNSIFPCYGMAESTLFVAGNRPASDTKDALEELFDGKYVASGKISDEVIVIVARSYDLKQCVDHEIGDIFIAGDSVSAGYLTENGFEPHETTFEVDGHTRVFHRTGDLGYIKRKRLYICGRDKNLIKIRGESFFFEDIEGVCELAIPKQQGVRCCALNGNDEHSPEDLLIIVEKYRRWNADDCERICAEIRTYLSSNLGISIKRLSFVPSMSLDRTSSGKLLRHQCKSRYLSGEMSIIHDFKFR